MVIREMSNEECLGVLAETRLVRLACAHENQPYIVPVYLAYDGARECLYGFTTPGQKIEWMRINPLVCVEVDVVLTYDQWTSVIAIGRYEELLVPNPSADSRFLAPERPRYAADALPPWSADNKNLHPEDERLRAWQLLKTLPEWWQPANAAWAARAHHDSAEPFNSICYKIWIDRVTGRKATGK